MADQPSSSSDQSSGDKDWGADWESAFEAEDEGFFAADGDTDFLLDAEEPAVVVSGSSDTGKSPETAPVGGESLELLDSLAESLDQLPDRSAGGFLSFLSGIPFFAAIPPAVAGLVGKISALPLLLRIPLCVVPLLILAVLLFVGGGKEKAPDTALPPPSSKSASTPTSKIAPASTGVTAVSPPSGEPPALAVPEKVRKKWRFSSFMIPVATGNPDQPVAFLALDLGLTVSLAPGEEPPAERAVFVREMVYQFYRGRSIEDLRTFSLARGDMSSQLLAWLRKQWPDGPIESVFFEQYRIS